MELRVLRYFLNIARESNITRAAHKSFVTQPTLSRQIKELEEELGHKLLIRGNHNVTLTDEGRILRKRAEEIIDLVDKTLGEFNYMQETIGGDIYIGGGESEGMKHIANLVKKLQTNYPKIHYHFYSGNADDVTERLDKGLLDFGVLIHPTDVSKYDYVDLPTKDSWGLVMPKDSPLAQKKTIQPQDLFDIPLLCSRQIIRQANNHDFSIWLGDDFSKLNIVSTYNLIYNAALMVKEGIGYALTLDKLINNTVYSELCFRPLEPKLEVGMCIVWKKNKIFSKAAKLFFDNMQNEFQIK